MSKNVGPVDRGLRLLIALAALIGAFVAGPASIAGIILFVVAAVMGLTSAVSFCPLYRLIGASTCKVRVSRSA